MLNRCLQITVCFATFFLVGCMLGPDHHQPDAPNLKLYSASHLSTSEGETKRTKTSQIYDQGAMISAQWWILFRSPVLTQLINTGLAQSPTITAACAALHASQETLNAQIGSAFLPSLTAQGGGVRERYVSTSMNQTTSPSIFNLFNASANVAYNFDFFGGERRKTEALFANAQYQAYQLNAARLTLAANIVTTTIAMAAIDEQIDVTKQLIKEQTKQLQIITQQYRYGAVSLDVKLSQETLLAQTKANLPSLKKAYAQYYHALNVLTGAYPSAPLPRVKLKDLYLPHRVPVSLPSMLVKQRPDILAAEALLHSASANVGVATAAIFPQIKLTASWGSQAFTVKDLFNPMTTLWSVGGQVAQPIFAGGSLLANRRAAIASLHQAQANYQQVVLQSFQNVADVLRALEYDERVFIANQQAENAARDALLLSKKQFGLGAISFLVLLNAEQQYQQTRVAVIQAKAARLSDTAAMFVALGGGWWNEHSQKNKGATLT